MHILIPLLGFVFTIVFWGEKQKLLFLLRIIYAFMVLSPLAIVYPVWSNDKSVVTIENGKVAYHPFGYPRWCKPYSVSSDGTLSTKVNSIAIGATDHNIVGKAICEVLVEFDILTYCTKYAKASYIWDYKLKEWCEEHNVSGWQILKEWVQMGMTEESKPLLIQKHFSFLKALGANPTIVLRFDPTIDVGERATIR